MTGVRIPITNVYGGGDYTAVIQVGNRKTPAHVILDTGSSTLAVKQSVYDADQDKAKKATASAQDVTYGTGGWAGPILKTTLAISGQHGSVGLPNGAVALALDLEPHNFGPADGVFGLAYNSLNTCYDLTALLERHGIRPPITYPWPFPARDTQSAVEQMQKIFQELPHKPLTPFFTQLVDEKKCANKFAFYTKRSMPKVNKNDPANRGLFILGGGEEQTDLFDGKFVNVDVVHDAWYNTTLKSIRVGDGAVIPAHPLAPEYAKTMFSNSVVDSGTNSLALSANLFKAVMQAFGRLNPAFAKLAAQSLQSGNGVANSSVRLAQWPNITFVLAGEHGEDISLTCVPQTYWQFDAGAAGRARFQINAMGQVQTILGLPLFNNYYTVFDRSTDKSGVVRFAPIK
jgi:hypothetical protein